MSSGANQSAEKWCLLKDHGYSAALLSQDWKSQQYDGTSCNNLLNFGKSTDKITIPDKYILSVFVFGTYWLKIA